MAHYYLFRSKIILLVVPVLCYCYDIEINISDTHGSKPIKIVCNSVDNETKMEEGHTVLWQGREFGFEDQHKITNSADGKTLMPNITIKSTDIHQCYILKELPQRGKE